MRECVLACPCAGLVLAIMVAISPWGQLFCQSHKPMSFSGSHNPCTSPFGDCIQVKAWYRHGFYSSAVCCYIFSALWPVVCFCTNHYPLPKDTPLMRLGTSTNPCQKHLWFEHLFVQPKYLREITIIVLENECFKERSEHLEENAARKSIMKHRELLILGQGPSWYQQSPLLSVDQKNNQEYWPLGTFFSLFDAQESVLTSLLQRI